MINFNQIVYSTDFKQAIIIFITCFFISIIISIGFNKKIKPLIFSLYGIIFVIGYTIYKTPTEIKTEPKKPLETITKKIETKNISNNPNIKIEVH